MKRGKKASVSDSSTKTNAYLGNWLPGTEKAANYEYDIPLKTTPEPTQRIRTRDRDRAEWIRLAGGPKPSLRERALSLAQEKGEVRTKDLSKIGVHRCYLARMCEEGLVIKVARELYRAFDWDSAA